MSSVGTGSKIRYYLSFKARDSLPTPDDTNNTKRKQEKRNCRQETTVSMFGGALCASKQAHKCVLRGDVTPTTWFCVLLFSLNGASGTCPQHADSP